MKSFKKFFEAKKYSNTDLADVNEILVGLYSVGENWVKFNDSKNVKKQLQLKIDKIGDENYEIQKGRAIVMVDEIIKWARSEGITSVVEQVWWTARPGVLSKAVGVDVDSRKNPTDTLLKFKTKEGTFIGISAKSTKGKGDIGFKNPGLGTIEKTLKIDLKSIYQKVVDDFIKQHDLPINQKVRKKVIRETGLSEEASLKQINVFGDMIDVLLEKLNTLDDTEKIEYLLENWMDAPDGLIPMYIKVTGHGNKAPFTATISDPIKNEKHSALLKGNIQFTKVGNVSIGVMAGSTRIMKLRIKAESQAMASSIKFSGDPWK